MGDVSDEENRTARADSPMATDDGLAQRSPSTIAVRVIWYIVGVILALLAFRFILPLVGANLNTGFANLIFGLTSPFVVPFAGLFRNTPITGTAQLEPNVLVAMAVYALVGWGLVKLVTIAK